MDIKYLKKQKRPQTNINNTNKIYRKIWDVYQILP